jgi:hypothetical protein
MHYVDKVYHVNHCVIGCRWLYQSSYHWILNSVIGFHPQNWNSLSDFAVAGLHLIYWRQKPLLRGIFVYAQKIQPHQ